MFTFSPSRTPVAIAALCALALTASPAQADPDLVFEWLDNNQVVSPTDSVLMRARVSNIGDMDLIDANAFGNILIFGTAPEVFDNYVEFLSGGFSFGPAGPFSIGVGESVDFTFAQWDTFPITGDIGDPVPAGVYTVPQTALLDLHYTTLNPFTEHPVDFSQAGDFVWTVRDTPDMEIPTPAALPAGLIGFAALAMHRRRVSR